ncbi:MAG: hypothetical protein LBV74_13510 [Tannerella sp.]|jgi:hypothetical protein|nr:hypothetical protein [Tannerella sp.]
MINKSKTAILLITFFVSFCEVYGADLYWRVTAVNNNFNNAANWTDSPTGIGGTSPGTPPTILDNVYFTNTSNYMDIKPTGTANMRNLTVTATGYKFSQNNINIAGSIALDGTFQITVGTVSLLNNVSPTDITIDFGTGNKIAFGSRINIDKPGVNVRLANNKLNTSALFELANTSFYSDGFDIEAGNFNALAATSNRTINLNGSTLTTTVNTPGLSSARSQFFANYTTFELDDCNFICNNEMIVLTGIANVTSTIRFKTITFRHYIETSLCASYISDGSSTNTYNWNLTAEKFMIETPSLQIRPLTNERARLLNLYITDEISFLQKGIITINSSNASNPTNLYINNITNSASGCGNMSVIQANTPTNFEATGVPITTQNIGYRGITFSPSGSNWTASEAGNLGGNSGNIIWTTVVSKDYYWIGGNGNWDDPAHWAFSSGGSPNPDGCVPQAVDNVIVDNLSFTAAGQYIYLESSTGCKNITWTDINRWGSLTISNSNTSLTINGNADFSGVTKNGIYPTLYFNGSGSQTITSAGDTTYSSKNIYFAGTGTYTLTNDFTTNSNANIMTGGTCGSHIFHNSGGFVSSGKTMDIGRFESISYPSGATRSFDFSNSDIKACFNSGAAGSAAVPVITLDNTGMSSYNFAGSHLIINSSGQTTNNYCILAAPGIIWTFYNISFIDPNASIRINTNNLYTYMANINKLTVDGHAVFTYGFKTDSLILSPSKTYTLTSGRPIEINKYMTTRSNGCNISEIKATSGTGILKANYPDFKLTGVNISRINASGSPLTIYGGIDGGNNLNVTINPLPSRNFYWVGGSGNWSDHTHWSIGTAGGNPALTNPEGCLPADLDSVFFDINSFTATGQTVTFDLAAVTIGSMIWTPEAGAKNPVFTTPLPNINITLNGSQEWAEQMKLGLLEGSVITFAGKGTTANSQYLRTNDVAPAARCIDYSFSGGGRYDVLGHINNACTLRLSGTTSSLYTNSYTINLKSCYLAQGASGTVDLGNSYINFYTTTVVNSSFTINNCANFHAENATISAYAFTIYNNCDGVIFNKLDIGYRLIASSASNTINARSITIQEGQGTATLINGKFVTDTLEFKKSPSTHTL